MAISRGALDQATSSADRAVRRCRREEVARRAALPPKLAGMDVAGIAALFVSVLALGFTLASFWWLNARRGSLSAATPRTYAYGAHHNGFRLRLPLALFNDGAVALMITHMRIAISDGEMQTWITTRPTLQPGGDEDGHAFATSFSVKGRDTRELIAEFGAGARWRPEPDSQHRIRLEALVHPDDTWTELTQHVIGGAMTA